MELDGRTLGEFTLREQIGEGGFAVVHRAEQPALERDAVVKVLHARLAARPEVVRRFLGEARLASRIDHPYAAHIYAYGAEPDDTLWIAMELVRGTAMDERLAAGGPMALSALVPLFERICDVVQHAHDRGIVHRDLKPSNVMVIDRGGRLLPKLLDFGLARVLDEREPEMIAAAPAPGAISATADWPAAATAPGATRRGHVMGSPAYMAPEQWVDASSVGPATDVYALGVLAYQALTGRLPYEAATVEAVRLGHLETPPPPLGDGFGPAVDAVLARALAKRAADRYPSAAALAVALRAAAGVRHDEPPGDDDAPYRGLAAFTQADAGDYVGREREIDAFVNRLLVEPFLAIVGPSGAGKSSFVQAGVVPLLPAHWRAIVVRPGASPLAALEAQLGAAGVAVRGLRDDPDALADGLRAAALRERATIVVVVDQLEELFTLTRDDGERAAYAAALAAATRTEVDPMRVVVTLRDDFLMRAGALPALGDRLARGLQLLVTPSPGDLARIVVEPARRAGYQLDDAALADEMVAEVADQPGALALLSFTAAAWWALRDRDARRLTRAAYVAIGGVGGALARHAETVLDALAPEDRRLVRVAFRNLVTVEGTRQVMTVDELQQVLAPRTERARAARVIDRLIDARLLVTSEDAGGAARVEVIHEALLSAWPRLVGWRREDAEGARLRDQLRVAARQWDERGRPRGLLWRDDALVEYQRWRARHPQPLTDVEEALAAASLAAASRGRRVRRALVLGAFVILAGGAALLYRSRADATGQRHLAEQRAAEIQTRLIESDTARGQQALLAGDFASARDALGRVIAAGAATPAVRFMMARASEPFTAEVATLHTDGGTAHHVLYSPDGGRLLTVGDGAAATLWDPDGRHIAALLGHSPGSTHGAWRPDGRQLATYDVAGTLRLWSRDGVLEATAAGPAFEAALPGVPSYRPDGAQVVASFARVVTIWDAAGAQVASWPADPTGISQVIFDPTGTRVLVAGRSGIASVWTLDGRKLLELRGHVGSVTRAIYAGDRIVTCGADMTARIWDARTGAQLHVLDSNDGRLELLAIDPGGQYVLTAGGEATPRVWRLETGVQIAMLRGHTGGVSTIAWPRDGVVVTGGHDGTVRVWDPLRELATGVFAHEGHVVDLGVAPSGGRVASASQGGTVKIWELARQARLASLTDPVAVGYHPPLPPVLVGRHLVRRGGHGLAGWDLAAPATHWTRAFDVTALALSPDGATAVAGDLGGGLVVLDAATGAVVRTLAGHRHAVRAIAILPDGHRVASCDERSIAIWDLASGRELHEHAIGAIDTLLASSSGALFGWNAGTNDEAVARLAWWADDELADVARFPMAATPTVVAFSPSGRWVVVASWTADVQIWSRDRTLARTLPGTAGSHAVAWSPDERLLAIGGTDGAIHVWDGATGAHAIGSERHDISATAIAFDASGALLATSGADRFVRVWGVAPLRLLARVPIGREYVGDVGFSGDALVTSGSTYSDVWRADLAAVAP